MRLLLLLLAAALCQAATEATIRKLIAKGGNVRLAPGRSIITREIQVPDGTTLSGKGAVLAMSAGFRGRALLVCGSGVTVSGLRIEGDRRTSSRRVGIAPSDRSFISFYDRNGIAAERVHGLTIRDVQFAEISSFSVLVAASKNVVLERLRVADSGSLNAQGRNNTTGGILLEEGTSEFVVRASDFARIRGNGIWTHSMYRSPRNGPGVFERNTFAYIGRDALQAGHATRMRIQNNTGHHVGYPEDIVDWAGGAVPVGIDTAGDVDQSVYTANRFTQINGKCIDLDGFHDGEVSGNTCIDSGHYAVVFNNTNPDMRSERIRIVNNVIDGTKYGGIFVIGRHHTISGNTMKRLNAAQCNTTPGCLYDAAQPDLLRAGIYLGAKAERPAPAGDNTITDNSISGFGMKEHCIVVAPGIDRKDQKIGTNECKDE